MTLLCSKHHTEKTKGLLPLEVVLAADKDPYSLRTGESGAQQLHFTGNSVSVRLGSYVFSFSGLLEGAAIVPLAIDGYPVIMFRVVDGNLLLNFLALDEFNQPYLKVNDSEVTFSAGLWDVEWTGRVLTMRTGRGQILLQIDFSPPTGIHLKKGRILWNGVELVVRPKFMYLINGNNVLADVHVVNVPVGLAIGSQPPDTGCAFFMSNVPRYGIDRASALAEIGRLARRYPS